MRKQLPAFLVVVLSLPLWLVSLALLDPSGAHAQSGPTADQIIARSFAARGGEDAWRGVQTARILGTLSMAGREGEFRVELKMPDKVRVELELGEVVHIQVRDGDYGWSRQMGAVTTPPQPLSPGELQTLRQQSDLAGPLLDWRQKGHQVELVGRRKIGNREFHTLRVVLAGGEELHIDLDAETFLEARIEGTRDVQGEGMEYLQLPGDYREVGGLLFPHALTQHLGNLTQVLRFYSVELDVPVSDLRFARPGR